MKKTFTEQELKQRLTPEEFRVTQQSGTEYPGTGKYNKFYKDGKYRCVVCGEELFTSEMKFPTSCGWPAFKAHVGESIEMLEDNSHGMRRVETRCIKCGAHLGHVFEDGPFGIRYCINSASLSFEDPSGKKE